MMIKNYSDGKVGRTIWSQQKIGWLNIIQMNNIGKSTTMIRKNTRVQRGQSVL